VDRSTLREVDVRAMDEYSTPRFVDQMSEDDDDSDEDYQGSMLQNTVSAENVSDKFSSSNFHPKLTDPLEYYGK
jgi:hypothetical protein